MSDVPSPEQLAEYQRLAEVTTAVQRAYQRGFEDGRRAVSTPAAEPTGDTGAPGGDELREQIAEAVATAGEGYWARADAVLALPAVRDALAAQETVRRVEDLVGELRNGLDLAHRNYPALVAVVGRLRYALRGDA
jgi:hypothetical protein